MKEATISLADIDGVMSNDAVLSIGFAIVVAEEAGDPQEAACRLAMLIDGIPDLQLPVASALIVLMEAVRDLDDRKKIHAKINRLCKSSKRKMNNDQS